MPHNITLNHVSLNGKYINIGENIKLIENQNIDLLGTNESLWLYNKKSGSKKLVRPKSKQSSSRSNKISANIFKKNSKNEGNTNPESASQNSSSKYPMHVLYESKSNKQIMKDLSERNNKNIYNTKKKSNNSMTNTSVNFNFFKKNKDSIESTSSNKNYQSYILNNPHSYV